MGDASPPGDPGSNSGLSHDAPAARDTADGSPASPRLPPGGAEKERRPRREAPPPPAGGEKKEKKKTYATAAATGGQWTVVQKRARAPTGSERRFGGRSSDA